jgi:lysophospholipase L1-like esterase
MASNGEESYSMEKKRVLCYGDSITWGYNPVDGFRMNENQRWTGLLATGLGDEYTVIEEGLNGRTTVWDDPLKGTFKNGLNYLIPCLASQKPLDLVILLLGTNDLKKRFSMPTTEISQGIKVLVEVILKSESGIDGSAPEILLMSPPYVRELTSFSDEFRNSYNKSRNLPDHIKKIADKYGCSYLDTSKRIVASELDGVHPDVGEHQKLGAMVLQMVQEII